jgi:thioester reductase-like protein
MAPGGPRCGVTRVPRNMRSTPIPAASRWLRLIYDQRIDDDVRWQPTRASRLTAGPEGLFLREAWSMILEADTTQPKLGLAEDVYSNLVNTVTSIIHNAWPMSIKRPVKGFESQFCAMRHLVDLVSAASGTRASDTKVNFSFVSSVAAVGQYPTWKKEVHGPEDCMSLEAVMPIGYAEAKHVCERMLDETLHRHPERFRTSAVRRGQIAGSKTSGYWNTTEHLAFIWKSSQMVQKIPALQAQMSWTPVDDMAGTLADLPFTEDPYAIYHIDNPVRQPWEDMMPLIADALHVPRTDVVPYEEWVDSVRNAVHLTEKDNPAAKLVDFLDTDFRRMSCGALLLDMNQATEHSETLRSVGPVSEEVVKGFLRYWRRIGFYPSGWLDPR